jgi:1,4-dihydroxy-2-naphthoate octaprenyltransferase
LGAVLPFWLRPHGFALRLLPAAEFVLAAALFHAGFSFLHARFELDPALTWHAPRLLRLSGLSIAIGCILGLHLHAGLSLHAGVPGSIFLVYGFSALLVGLLYVVPPLRFHCRAGGEVVISGAMGLLPVLGAYLVQVGDITRTVCLASAPLVLATALWVWTGELATRSEDIRTGRQTMVILFGPRFSGRIAAPAICVLFSAALLLAVFTSSVSPWALTSVVAYPHVWKIAVMCWRDYESAPRMREARHDAATLHLSTCIIFVAASLVPIRL